MEHDFQIQDGVLISYNGREESITIPEGIHTLGEDALKACVSLKQIILPHSLRRIMPRALKGCRNLQKLQIPEGVSYIGDYAFHRCHSLETIYLPASVDELGNSVFLFCDKLREVHIPGVRRLGSQVFLNDIFLEKLVISKDLEPECIRDVFTCCGRLSDISFPDGERFLIPNLVEAAIGELAVPYLIQQIVADVLGMFELDGHRLVRFRTNLKHVEIPEGIEEIGKSCFFDKRGILSVALPASLKRIGSRAFRNCIGLETVTFKDTHLTIDDDAFKNCTLLKKLVMPDGVEYSLQGITNFTSDEVPELVRTVHQQVLGNFRICGTTLLKYLGNESRVAVPDGVTVIAEEAFAGKEEMDRILLPDSLEEIGAGAFRSCLTLQSAVLPASVKKIGEGAFENCVKLIRISLPDSVETVEGMIFRHCRQLREVRFGENVREIGEQAFSGCSSLMDVKLPERLSVIGTMAFYRCSKLNHIELPPQINQVGNLAFAQSGLKSARISCGCREFGTDLFADCTKLTNIMLCEGVRHIPDKFAYGCTALDHIVLPETLESIGRNAMEKTPFLKRWKETHLSEWEEKQNEKADENKTPEDIKTMDEAGHSDISRAIFWDGTSLSGDIRIPNQYRIIAGGAFYGNSSITTIYLPNTIRWVGKAAFKGCTSLVEATWPAGIRDAQAEVFSRCTSLTLVRHAPAWNSIGYRAFFHCGQLRRLCLKETKYIGDEAFFGCGLLAKTEVGNADFIGFHAFKKTKFAFHETLNFVPLPSLTSFGPSPLDDPDYPVPLAVGSTIVEPSHYRRWVKIPDGITGIAPYTFAGDSCIMTLELPESLEWIGEGAFFDCCSLREITFPSKKCRIDARAFEKCISLEKILFRSAEVNAAAFAYCTSLEEVTVSGIAALREHAFEGCSSLKQFTCTDTRLKEVGDYCFSGCSQLKKIDLSGIRNICRYAFEDCDSLERITLPFDAQIEPYAFADCCRLKEIDLPGDNPTLSLREYAFSGCTALKRIALWELNSYQDLHSRDIPESVRMIFYNALSCFDVEKDSVLYGYHGSGRILFIPEGIRQIQPEVFRDFISIQEVHIPESVEYIGARAFHGTEWLKEQQTLSPMVIVNHMLLDGSTCSGEVTIPEDIRTVCGWAFANGMDIKKINFLSDRVNVEDFAFRNCINLEEVQLPNYPVIRLGGIEDRERELPPLAKQIVLERLNCFKTDSEHTLVECTGNITELLVADGITRIGDHVFQESNLMTEIILPQTVTSIGKGAFANCKWLREVRQPALQKNTKAGKNGDVPSGLSSPDNNPKSNGAKESGVSSPGGIREIEDLAFSNCGVLHYVELSEAFTKLGKRAFEHCVYLQEILLPEGLEEIPERAFFRCHNLKNVTFPSTLKRIGKEAFAFCDQLDPPVLPDGVEIGERAFVKSDHHFNPQSNLLYFHL